MPEFEGLLEGYRRFRESGYPIQRARYDKLVSEGQHPKTLIISCSDSRVDPSQIFDVDPGEIFVVRNVAALVPPFETTPGQHGVSAAVEFAVQFLKVRQILVMGHGMCGGCEAALSQDFHGNEPGAGGFVANWVRLLDNARAKVVAEHGTEGPEAKREMEFAAVRQSLANLRTFPWIRSKEESGELNLRGTFFAISEGVLYHLDKGSDEFGPIE
ncbi:carbonic anhydrase [Alteriqipengyuania lutimaris]|uniref:Carbonic anhydrase n=1 Tax=Alteriqipengyuania lutimaris TaxID=1538146 RepID=A0A395LM31_9SPHN|nr:carbonic anhydrase [Alteriqipengyuania lutimaris]MBB3032848.1 carbonic anhydrase [Alteriqipengyuania lutimaris]RDS78058.1 carbonic anhydrase [Alteriqipengyuania lutimaris]